MFRYIEQQKNKWYAWFAKRAHGPHVKAWLAFISFSESIFFPIPTAAFLIPILMTGAARWLYYALFTTFFSILGGVVGYLIAYLFFDAIGVRIIEFYGLTKELAQVQEMFNNNAFFVTFIGAFTPIPYKVFVLGAGFLKINIIAFVAASILGRSLQFLLIGYVMKLFGPTLTKLFLRYFNIVVLILIMAFVISRIL